MNFLERNLEDIIYENSLTKEGREKLRERGLVVEGKMYRQVDIGGFGRIDLLECGFTKNKNNILVPYTIIYELKRNEISVEALMQACRYVCGIKSHLTEYIPMEMIGKRGRPSLFVKLIGEKFNNTTDFMFLYSNMRRFVEAYTFDYNIDGISFRTVDRDVENSLLNITHNNSFSEAYVYPSFSLLRDALEPYRNQK